MAGVTFTNSVTLGAVLLGVVVALAGIASLMYGARWKSAWEVASAQAEELRRALDDERSRAERLEARLAEAMVQLADSKQTIERLSHLPNLERVVKLMSDTAERAEQRAQQRLAGALAQLEQQARDADRRAEERHRKEVIVLEMIADRLGPDPNGH